MFDFAEIFQILRDFGHWGWLLVAPIYVVAKGLIVFLAKGRSVQKTFRATLELRIAIGSQEPTSPRVGGDLRSRRRRLELNTRKI